jgi:oxalate---CoA ligase
VLEIKLDFHLQEISELLDGFDPRIVEHVLQGFERSHPSPNMLDFGVIVMVETYGRERRHRWFTFKGYKTLLNQENINEAEHGLYVDLTNTGGFTDVLPELFYEKLDQLHNHQDTDDREETTKKKRKPPKNPILPDGTVKRGRPRKNQGGAGKRKREDLGEDDGVDDQVHPSKRAKVAAAGGNGVVRDDQGTPVAEPAPKKRGRPPKRKPEGEPSAIPTPRKRGRPPKKRTPTTVGQQETQDDEGLALSMITPLPVPAQKAVPEVTRDEIGLQYPETSGQTIQRVSTPEANTLHPAGVPQQNSPPEPQPLAPESRGPVQTSQQCTDGVRASYRT